MTKEKVRKLKKFIVMLVYCPKRDEIIDAGMCWYCEHKVRVEWNYVLCKYVKEVGCDEV